MQELVERLEKLEAKATPGPWADPEVIGPVGRQQVGWVLLRLDGSGYVATDIPGRFDFSSEDVALTSEQLRHGRDIADAALIVALRNEALPALKTAASEIERKDARIAELEGMAPLASFGAVCAEAWPHGGIDGFELQEMLLENGVIRAVPGGYDPETCTDGAGVGPEPGDPWFEMTPESAAAATLAVELCARAAIAGERG
jgi:hypothetical protein